MIVPGKRLLIWVALLLPFAAVGGMVPEARSPAVGLWLLLAVLAAADAAAGFRRPRRVRIGLPGTVRLFHRREGVIPLEIQCAGPVGGRLRVGLPLPPGIESRFETLEAEIPAETSACRVRWPCRSDTRGRFDLPACHYELPSPLGFWDMRGIVRHRTEIRVYPDMLRERNRLAALFLNRADSGTHLRSRVGKGREFEQLRDYVPGDGYEDIHWKATAKRGRPVTKLFRVERTQEIYVAVDGSRLSARRLDGLTVLDRFLASALVLALAAEKNGDRFGLLAFSDRVDRFVRAGAGSAHYHACRDAVYTRNPRLVTPDYAALASCLRTRIRRRALVLVLTDLSDPTLAESYARSMALASAKHVVLTILLKQPGTAPLFSSPDAEGADALYERLAGHLAWREIRELERTLKHRGIGLSEVDEAGLTAHLVSRYLDIKRRQLL